jgi:hypothetical protein
VPGCDSPVAWCIVYIEYAHRSNLDVIHEHLNLTIMRPNNPQRNLLAKVNCGNIPLCDYTQQSSGKTGME